VWEHANLAQKNLSIVDLVPGDFALVPVVLRNPRAVRVVLEVWRESKSPKLEVGLVHRSASFFGRRARRRPFEPRLASDVAHAALAERAGLMDCGGPLPAGPADAGAVLTSRTADRIPRRFAESVELPVRAGTSVRVPVDLPAAASTTVGLLARVPADAEAGEEFCIQLVQREARSKRLLGGVSLLVRARGDAGETAVP
jgi:hypothetical protein